MCPGRWATCWPHRLLTAVLKGRDPDCPPRADGEMGSGGQNPSVHSWTSSEHGSPAFGHIWLPVKTPEKPGQDSTRAASDHLFIWSDSCGLGARSVLWWVVDMGVCGERAMGQCLHIWPHTAVLLAEFSPGCRAAAGQVSGLLVSLSPQPARGGVTLSCSSCHFLWCRCSHMASFKISTRCH